MAGFTDPDVFQGYTKTGSKIQKLQAKQQIKRAQAAVKSIEEAQQFRVLEDPREQAGLKQSLYGRGLGKSSIATEDTARLGMVQGHRNAQLARQWDLAKRELKIAKKHQKLQKRTRWATYVQGAATLWGAVLGNTPNTGGKATGGADYGTASTGFSDAASSPYGY